MVVAYRPTYWPVLIPKILLDFCHLQSITLLGGFPFLRIFKLRTCCFLDSMIAAVKPKPPARHVRDGLEEDDDDDLVIVDLVFNSFMELKDNTCLYLFVKYHHFFPFFFFLLNHFFPFAHWNVEISASAFNQWMEKKNFHFSAWQVKATW